jgi:GNAT superfamily N-acetyltransferase/predicted enzyme related to lactoylglutathione lyase
MPTGSTPSHVFQLRLVVEADDFDEALTFYRDVLDLAEQAAFSGDDDARVVILDAGRATLELANPAQRRMIDAVEVGRPVSPKIRVAFEVDDSTAMTAALVDAGATLIAPPTETPWRSLNSRLAAPADLQITLFEELEPLEVRQQRDGFGVQGAPQGANATPIGEPSIRRLQAGDREVARETFVLIAEVFETQNAALSGSYIDGLLARSDFWAIAATVDGHVVGGLTAHTLAMTVFEGSEVLLYDIAVSEGFQRRGIGRLLVEALLDGARELGIKTVFVPADNEDTHALDFYRALNGAPQAVTMFDFDTAAGT